jgi:kanamycin kinase
VHEIANGRDVAAVWINELGGVTFRIGATGELSAEFVKSAPPQYVSQLKDEAVRLKWARPHIAVPEVLDAGDGWLHTAGLPGRSAVDPRWLDRPRAAARAIGSGLRGLHDALPVDDCPFEWSVASRLAELPARRRAGLEAAPPVDRLVVCHGDACAPNTLIDDGGTCSGHVDLGNLGVADRWADLAVATLSLGWNYGPGRWDRELLDAYGVDDDPARIAYYRALWQAGDVSSSAGASEATGDSAGASEATGDS